MPALVDAALVPRRGSARGLAAAFGAALVAVLLGAASAGASQQEYERALELGSEAYEYGLPLLSTDRTFREQTSVERPVAGGFAPVNRFSRAPGLTRPEDRTVVAPNHDTLYSIAWLDLRREPIVIHVPRIRDRYFVIPLIDPYTEDFKDLGSVKRTRPGDYVVTGPGQHRVRIPPGTRRIESRYDRLWIIARTAIRNEDEDVRRAVRIERRYTLTPLSRYGTGWKPRYPRHADTAPDEVAMPTGLAFFDRLGTLLERFPPPAADRPELERLAEVGIGPGLRPSSDPTLSADTLRGLTDAVAGGPDEVLADVRAAYLAGFADHNGWLVTPTGRYGTDYARRASAAQIGLGASVPRQAIYPFAQVDSAGRPLTGARRYVVHFAPGGAPPVRAFWSLTMYDTDGFFVPNPIDRYLINDRSDLRLNPDGSLDVFVQHDRPSDPLAARNWLPAPKGTFRLLMRLYATRSKRIAGVLDGTGWRPPSVTAVP